MRKILIVDDEQDVRTLLAEYFVNQEFLVAVAKDGREAIENLKQERFDVVICDYLMPDMDGLGVVKYVTESHPDLPVIWISGNAQAIQYREAWRSGLFDYIEKPFRFSDIDLAVQKALSFGKKADTGS